MKQILIPKTIFKTGSTSQFSTNTLVDNPVGFVHLDALNTLLATAPTKDFAIMYRSGKTQAPSVFEVDYNTLTVVKSEPNIIFRIEHLITVPAGEMGNTYTVNLIKRNATTHERNVYRISVHLTADCTAKELSAKLVKQFDNIKDSIDIEGLITVIQPANTDKLAVTVNPIYCNVSFTDKLTGIAVTETPANQETVTLNEKDLYRRISECIGNRGVQYRYEEGPTIYPYVERLDASKTYNVYTLRFATERKAAKTRDEQVWQLIHIIVDTSLTDLVTILNGIKSA